MGDLLARGEKQQRTTAAAKAKAKAEPLDLDLDEDESGCELEAKFGTPKKIDREEVAAVGAEQHDAGREDDTDRDVEIASSAERLCRDIDIDVGGKPEMTTAKTGRAARKNSAARGEVGAAAAARARSSRVDDADEHAVEIDDEDDQDPRTNQRDKDLQEESSDGDDDEDDEEYEASEDEAGSASKKQHGRSKLWASRRSRNSNNRDPGPRTDGEESSSESESDEEVVNVTTKKRGVNARTSNPDAYDSSDEEEEDHDQDPAPRGQKKEQGGKAAKAISSKQPAHKLKDNATYEKIVDRFLTYITGNNEVGENGTWEFVFSPVKGRGPTRIEVLDEHRERQKAKHTTIVSFLTAIETLAERVSIPEINADFLNSILNSRQNNLRVLACDLREAGNTRKYSYNGSIKIHKPGSLQARRALAPSEQDKVRDDLDEEAQASDRDDSMSEVIRDKVNEHGGHESSFTATERLGTPVLNKARPIVRPKSVTSDVQGAANPRPKPETVEIVRRDDRAPHPSPQVSEARTETVETMRKDDRAPRPSPREPEARTVTKEDGGDDEVKTFGQRIASAAEEISAIEKEILALKEKVLALEQKKKEKKSDFADLVLQKISESGGSTNVIEDACSPQPKRRRLDQG